MIRSYSVTVVVGCCLILQTHPVGAHDLSRLAFLRMVALAQDKADAAGIDADEAARASGACVLVIDLLDAEGRSVPGIVRITDTESGKALQFRNEFHRAMNWHALAEKTALRVPRKQLRIEALRGLETELTVEELNLENVESFTARLRLRQFYDAHERGLVAGNTHLHLMNLTHAEADRYLRLVPRADDLRLVFLSYLRRIPDERTYITNMIVENSFAGGDLQRLSESGVLFANGQEHRHNFGRGGEGYGHVMLLDIPHLIRPVSIGPGIMAEGTDAPPLARGILEARRGGATVIWCHNALGLEDLPNWTAGRVHAQNIYDGSPQGTFEETYYRYLNLGMQVPFSTGTDWFIYDFSRVYVPVDGELTSAKWLAGLREGRSTITNGPLLELETERGGLGDTLAIDRPATITVVARGTGRLDFGGLELVYNGRVVHREEAVAEGGHYRARLRHRLEVSEPGWFAVRIPPDAGTTELDRPLFAHTSPIYVEMAGERIFRKDVARAMVEEMRESIETITAQAKFADDAERESVVRVYHDGIAELERRIQAAE